MGGKTLKNLCIKTIKAVAGKGLDVRAIISDDARKKGYQLTS